MLVDYSSDSESLSDCEPAGKDVQETVTLRPVHLSLSPTNTAPTPTEKRQPSRLEGAYERTRARPLINAFDQFKRKRGTADRLTEKRLTGNCDSSYDCSKAYLVCELAQLFDPCFLASNAVDSKWVQRLAAINPIARAEGGTLLGKLEGELPAYMAAAVGFTCDYCCVITFTEAVLGWWKRNASELPSWSLAARIVFSFSPNSCGCERVFSLLKTMFGEGQDNCLADYLQSALMLRHNKRVL